jgi:hypothetical protein
VGRKISAAGDGRKPDYRRGGQESFKAKKARFDLYMERFSLGDNLLVIADRDTQSLPTYSSLKPSSAE